KGTAKSASGERSRFWSSENELPELSSSSDRERARKCGLLRCSGEKFSDLRTVWRRERDSNPRYPFRYSGFQDRLFQPLTHLSAWWACHNYKAKSPGGSL